MTEFKVGNRVRYIHQTGLTTPNFAIGEIGTIRCILTGRYPIEVWRDDKCHDSFARDELELAHPISRIHQVQP